MLLLLRLPTLLTVLTGHCMMLEAGCSKTVITPRHAKRRTIIMQRLTITFAFLTHGMLDPSGLKYERPTDDRDIQTHVEQTGAIKQNPPGTTRRHCKIAWAKPTVPSRSIPQALIYAHYHCQRNNTGAMITHPSTTMAPGCYDPWGGGREINQLSEHRWRLAKLRNPNSYSQPQRTH